MGEQNSLRDLRDLQRCLFHPSASMLSYSWGLLGFTSPRESVVELLLGDLISVSHASWRGVLQLRHLGYRPFGTHQEMEKNSNSTTVQF